MKLLICTFRRPDGSTYSSAARLDGSDEATALTTIQRTVRYDRLIEKKIAESTAVRVASARNTTIGENLLDPPADTGPDMTAGVQHADAVGGESTGNMQDPNAVLRDSEGNEVDGDAEVAGAAPVDPFADVSDPGDTPPDEPHEGLTAASTPSRKKK